MKVELKQLLKEMAAKNASDIHFKIGAPPTVRVKQDLINLPDYPALTQEDMMSLIFSIMGDTKLRLFEENREIDLAFTEEGVGRFRANIFKSSGEPGFVLRHVKSTIPSFEELNIPLVLRDLTKLHAGFVLVTGATSQGKSTTLACMIDYINDNRPVHIVTVEDPIEYLHADKKAMVRQREVGIDTNSFDDSLKYLMRQDPDVILIGEMRDPQTFRAAINASDTGHLVFSTLHAADTIQSLNRVIDLFPVDLHRQVRIQLSQNLRAITCQRLIKHATKEGVIPAFEVMIVNAAISVMIRDGKFDKIKSVMQNSTTEGMQTFNQSLLKLLNEKKITKEEALSKSDNPEALIANIKGIFLDDDRSVIGD